MVRPITESRVASNQTGFLAVAQKGRYLLMPGRPRLDDLQIIGVIELICFVHGKKGLPGVSHHASVSELGGGTVVWWSRQHCRGVHAGQTYSHQGEKT